MAQSAPIKALVGQIGKNREFIELAVFFNNTSYPEFFQLKAETFDRISVIPRQSLETDQAVFVETSPGSKPGEKILSKIFDAAKTFSMEKIFPPEKPKNFVQKLLAKFKPCFIG